ncbi:MAG: thioredoxin domain-containing protein, partial [Caulobacterales bacterium]
MIRVDPTRRSALAGATALAAAPAWAKPAAGHPDDMALGDPRARVTVVEYASVGCPHCAHWNNEVFAAFKAKYIDTRKVLFVLRECLTGDPDVAAAGFLLARCAGKDKYFQVVDAIFHGQASMYDPGNSAGAGGGAGGPDTRRGRQNVGDGGDENGR